jgi:hypothetical protein
MRAVTLALIGVCAVSVVSGCQYKLRAQTQYVISPSADNYLEKLAVGLTALGFVELTSSPSLSGGSYLTQSYSLDPVRVDFFSEDGGRTIVLGCTEGKEEFTDRGRVLCDSVGDLLAGLPGEVTKREPSSNEQSRSTLKPDAS